MSNEQRRVAHFQAQPEGPDRAASRRWWRFTADGESSAHFAHSIDNCYRAAMKFSLADPGDGYTINAYSNTELVVGEQHFKSSIIILADRIISDWSTRTVEQLKAADFEALLDLKPDLVLLGTGERQQFPPPDRYRCLIGAGIGLEIMTTPAACRTYNILVSEGRRVAAALIL